MSHDVLADIVARKRVEIRRRQRHAESIEALLNPVPFDPDRGRRALEVLRRNGAPLPNVLAEIKFCSPSAGVIRSRTPGDVTRIARAYAAGGVAAISVLADGPGFGGSVLDVRRAASVVPCPVLFKEFVLDECQVRWARAAGASLVLLIVRALEDDALISLVDATRRAGLEPVVEAADAAELERALRTGASIVGVNARDLRTFHVDAEGAEALVARIPTDRVAIRMSGIRTKADYRSLATSRADVVLVGEGLMRTSDPAAELAAWRA